MKCDYCKRTLKNKHGVHVHWFYCKTKAFTEMKIKMVNPRKAYDLREMTQLLSVRHYPYSYLAFTKNGEIGMMFGVRYILAIK